MRWPWFEPVIYDHAVCCGWLRLPGEYLPTVCVLYPPIGILRAIQHLLHRHSLLCWPFLFCGVRFYARHCLFRVNVRLTANCGCDVLTFVFLLKLCFFTLRRQSRFAICQVQNRDLLVCMLSGTPLADNPCFSLLLTTLFASTKHIGCSWSKPVYSQPLLWKVHQLCDVYVFSPERLRIVDDGFVQALWHLFRNLWKKPYHEWPCHQLWPTKLLCLNAILIICVLLLGVFTLFPPLDGVAPTLSAYQPPTGCHFTSRTFVFCVTLVFLSSHKSVATLPSEVSTVVRTCSWSLLLFIMIPHAMRVLACACLQTPVCSPGYICGSAAS